MGVVQPVSCFIRCDLEKVTGLSVWNVSSGPRESSEPEISEPNLSALLTDYITQQDCDGSVPCKTLQKPIK